MEFTHFSTYCRLDSAIYGDILAGRRDIYAFGFPSLQSSLDSLVCAPPNSLSWAYSEIGLTIIGDTTGFTQTHPIGESVGLEIRVTAANGSWVYSGAPNQPKDRRRNSPLTTQMAQLPGNCTASRRRRTYSFTLRAPIISPAYLSGDGYSNDAIWRSPPAIFWEAAVMQASNVTNTILSSEGLTGAITRRGPPTCVRGRPWESRLICLDIKRVGFPKWCNLAMPRRGSLPL